MQDKVFIEALEHIGLPDKAARIYLALLRHPRLSVAEISRETGIKRPTCYEYLDTLIARDFVIRVPIGRRTLFSPVEPKKVLANQRRRTAAFELCVGQMARVHDAAIHKPKVAFYQGKREIKGIYEDVFRTVGDAYSIFPAEAFFESFTTQDYDEFDKELSVHALTSRDLMVHDRYFKRICEIRKKNGGDRKHTKRLPPDFKSNVDVVIYSQKVALISLKDLSALVIENSDIAELFKNIHNFLWKHANS